jgi:hypothetical protein
MNEQGCNIIATATLGFHGSNCLHGHIHRVTTSSNKLTEPVETDDSSVVNTASASAGTAVDEGDTIDGVASCAQTAQEQRGSPADSEAAGFAFVGSTDCPTPAPMGQKVSRCASFTLAAGTELPFPESIQLATADASQTAKTLHQQLPHDADGVHQEEECQTPAARRTAGRLATSFSAPEARPSTAAAGDAQPVHQRESVRPSTLQSAAAADVHGSRTTADPQQKNTALSDPGSDLSGEYVPWHHIPRSWHDYVWSNPFYDELHSFANCSACYIVCVILKGLCHTSGFLRNQSDLPP